MFTPSSVTTQCTDDFFNLSFMDMLHEIKNIIPRISSALLLICEDHSYTISDSPELDNAPGLELESVGPPLLVSAQPWPECRSRPTEAASQRGHRRIRFGVGSESDPSPRAQGPGAN